MQQDQALREIARIGLEGARDARRRDDLPLAVAQLEAALAAAIELGDASLLATVCWRLAKARYDADDTAHMVASLAPLMGGELEERGVWGVKRTVGPFDLYAPSLRALEPLARRHWDTEGYGLPLLAELWGAWSEAQAAAGEPFLAAWGDVQRAWQWACSGHREALEATVQRVVRLSPDHFQAGTHRHPAAPDGPASAPWLELDVARTALRSATWGGRERDALDAMDIMEDAAETAELRREADPWFLDAAVHAADRFGWDAVAERYIAAWAERITHTDVPATHQQLASGLLARRAGRQPDAAHAYLRAADLAREQRRGPEWVVSAHLGAARSLAADAPAAAEAQRELARCEARRTAVFMEGLAGPQADA